MIFWHVHTNKRVQFQFHFFYSHLIKYLHCSESKIEIKEQITDQLE